MPNVYDYRQPLRSRPVDPEMLGAGGQFQGLNMGIPMGQLYQASSAEDAYADMMAQQMRGLYDQGGADLMGLRRMGIQEQELAPLLQALQGAQGFPVQPSGITDTVGQYQQGMDFSRMLEDFINSQDPSFLESIMPGLFPLAGAGAGMIPGVGLPAALFLGQLGSGLGSMYASSQY